MWYDNKKPAKNEEWQVFFLLAGGGLTLFDPTIYENIKVVIEGAIYDLDLAKKVTIINRIDRIELSTMSRYYAIQFELLNQPKISSELCLTAHISDFASEILEQVDHGRGCNLEIRFHTTIDDLVAECNTIHIQLQNIWGNEHEIEQEISFQFNEHEAPKYHNEITLHFQQKMNENHIDDMPRLIDHILQSLELLGS